MTPQELETVIDDKVRWEGSVPTMYLDVNGFVTVGIGHLLYSPESAQDLEFWAPGMNFRATPEQVAADFRRVVSIGQATGDSPRRGWHYYQSPNSPALKGEYVNRLTEHRIIGEFVPGLRGIFSDFDGYPLPARRALLDLAYNIGVHGVSKFTHLIAACESGNWHTAAEECSTKNGRVDRNEWRSAMFLEAASPAVA